MQPQGLRQRPGGGLGALASRGSLLGPPALAPPLMLRPTLQAPVRPRLLASSSMCSLAGVPSAASRVRPARSARGVSGAALPGLVAAAATRAAPRRPPASRRANIVAQYAAVPASVIAEPSSEEEAALPLPRAVESAVDDPLLHNPLQRMERMGTGWFGVIADYEGVLVDSTLEIHKEAWRQVAVEGGMPMPLGSTLNRINGMRDEAIIMQLFAWTRNPQQASRIATRKEEIYDTLMNGNTPAEVPGVRAFLETLQNFNVPVALASPLPERRVRPAVDRLDLARAFAAVVTAEDNGSPDLENTYLVASHALQRPPLRCVVVGDSNRSVEAAHELGMKSVVVTGGQPAWNFGGADLVVRNLGQLTFLNLKNLFAREDLVESSTPWEDIREAQRRDEEEALSRSGSGSGAWRTSSGVSAASAMSKASSLGSAASSSTAWDPEEVREPAVVAAQQQWWPRGSSNAAGGDAMGEDDDDEEMSSLKDEDDDFEVILPPKGAAFWDH